MALADSIARPDVGTRLLNTFSVLSEENRKRKEMEFQQSKQMQDLAIKASMYDIRERTLDLRGTVAADQSRIAQAKLELDQLASTNKAAKDEIAIQSNALKLQRQEDDVAAARELHGILSIPGPGGKTLNQLMVSPIEAERDMGLDLYAKHTARLRGRGPETEKALNNIENDLAPRERTMLARQNAELAAKREQRQAAGQERDDARADAGMELKIDKEVYNRGRDDVKDAREDAKLEDQKRRTSIAEDRAKAKAFGGGSTKAGEFYPGGSEKIEVGKMGKRTVDSIRETLAAGGAEAAALEAELQKPYMDATSNEHPSPWTPEVINEWKEQGKNIRFRKGSGTKTPSGVSVEPLKVTPDTDVDAFFKRAPKAQPVNNQQLAPEVPASTLDESAPLLPSLSGGSGAMEFWGLPRTLQMA